MTPQEEFPELPSVLRDFQPTWGLVLGSGLGTFVESVETIATVSFSEIPGLPTSRVPGHAGQFVLAKIGTERVIIAQGRVHLYEGRSAREVTAFIRLMSSLGATRLLLTNAAGSMNTSYHPGSWMMLHDHLNFTGTSPLTGGPNFVDMSEVYCARLGEIFSSAAAASALPMPEGIYAGVLGPQYETPAEIRMLRGLGADVVGMSTVLEAIQARALGMRVAAFSCITNWAAGMQAKLDHEEVLRVGREAGEIFARMLHYAFATGKLSPSAETADL